MSTVQEIVTYKDSRSVELLKSHVTELPISRLLQTSGLDVPGLADFKWYIVWYPTGYTAAEKDHISLYLQVNKPVKAMFKFQIDGSSIQMSSTCEFVSPKLEFGWPKYASHADLHPLFQNDKLMITCNVEFYIPVQRELSVPRMFQFFGHVPTDVELIVGSDSVPAHKNFLSLISPVFNAMFSHNTAEAKSNKVNIAEFDIESVQSAIDYCYGRKLKLLSVETSVNILRFCDKYFLTAAIEDLEKLTVMIPTTENFCHIVRYAYVCYRSSLLADCCKLFKEHQSPIQTCNTFAELPLTLVIDVIKKSFDLKTNFDVLHHAHKTGITFVVEHLEEPLIESMTLQNFCPAAKFAIECSRYKLLCVCAKFLNENREMITDSVDFLSLPSETVHMILISTHALKRI